MSREQKLSFLRNVYLVDSHNSLDAANKAAEWASTDLGAKYNPNFDYSDIENRWVAFSKTNHLLTLSTNISTNIIYDIILASDTNRVQVIRDWGNDKLFLLKLQNAAVLNSLAGEFLCYSNSLMNSVDSFYLYRNVVWATFKGIDNKDTKFEFKYEKDAGTTNVQDIQVTSTNLIFDHVAKFSILPP